tara:strand:+ start:9020 stop:9406 length:387 start_codon:yes stop_codon:yes gene_type:complete
MRWQTGDANTKKKPEIVVPGWYTGKIQFADENEKHNKIRVTIDLDDGQRVRFNIGPRHGSAALAAIGQEGTVLEASDLVGAYVKVKLDQWSPDDDPDRVYNTLQEIESAAEEVSDGKDGSISKDDIPF